MALVKVWNENKFPYEEKFRGQNIHIPVGGFVEMEDDQAVLFLGTFNSPKYTSDGGHDARGYKMLRIEKTIMQPKASEIVCQRCFQKFLTSQALESHIDEMHLDEILDPKVSEERRKRGRPRKEESATA